jgi:hypothetical protein
MDLLAMALVTNSRGMNKSEDRSDFMPYVSVAICAFDLVIGDMIFMHELRGVFGAQ